VDKVAERSVSELVVTLDEVGRGLWSVSADLEEALTQLIGPLPPVPSTGDTPVGSALLTRMDASVASVGAVGRRLGDQVLRLRVVLGLVPPTAVIYNAPSRP